jgi:hypothetical protein
VARHHPELQKSGNLSRERRFPALQTVLGTTLQACTNPQCPHPQRAGRDPERSGEPIAVLDLVAFVSLVIAQNERAMVGRQSAQTETQAFHVTIVIVFRLRRHDVRLWRFVQRSWLPGPIAAHLEQKHPRDANAVGGEVADGFSVRNLPRAAIDGLVSVFLGGRAPSPFEKADKLSTNLEVPIRGELAVWPKQRQQAVEGRLRERPRLTTGTSKGI